MCESKMPGFFARQRIYSQGRRAVARDARNGRPCACHQPAAAKTATDRAQEVLAVVGVVVLMASVSWIMHALAIALSVIFIAPCGVAGYKLKRRLMRCAAAVPAPLPGAPRTMVTGVTVRALQPPDATAFRRHRDRGRIVAH